jgi:hypothetical protein
MSVFVDVKFEIERLKNELKAACDHDERLCDLRQTLFRVISVAILIRENHYIDESCGLCVDKESSHVEDFDELLYELRQLFEKGSPEHE